MSGDAHPLSRNVSNPDLNDWRVVGKKIAVAVISAVAFLGFVVSLGVLLTSLGVNLGGLNALSVLTFYGGLAGTTIFLGLFFGGIIYLVKSGRAHSEESVNETDTPLDLPQDNIVDTVTIEESREGIEVPPPLVNNIVNNINNTPISLLPSEQRRGLNLSDREVVTWRNYCYQFYSHVFSTQHRTREGLLSFNAWIEEVERRERMQVDTEFLEIPTPDNYIWYYTFFCFENHDVAGVLPYNEWASRQSILSLTWSNISPQLKQEAYQEYRDRYLDLHEDSECNDNLGQLLTFEQWADYFPQTPGNPFTDPDAGLFARVDSNKVKYLIYLSRIYLRNLVQAVPFKERGIKPYDTWLREWESEPNRRFLEQRQATRNY